MMLGDMTRSLKDGALGLSLKTFLNERLSKYGKIIECKIDTRRACAHLTAIMHGDPEPVSAIVERYELEREGGEHYIVLRKINSSHPQLMQLFAGKRYKLPAAIYKLF